MKSVRVTRDAERDLDQIWIYIARDNMDAANRLAPLVSGLRSHPVATK